MKLSECRIGEVVQLGPNVGHIVGLEENARKELCVQVRFAFDINTIMLVDRAALSKIED